MAIIETLKAEYKDVMSMLKELDDTTDRAVGYKAWKAANGF